jgi:hypothetical protein
MKGTRPFRDSMIAATAMEHGFSVVTRNVGDFADAGACSLSIRSRRPLRPQLAGLGTDADGPYRLVELVRQAHLTMSSLDI